MPRSSPAATRSRLEPFFVHVGGFVAVIDGQYAIEGDGGILTRFSEWFPSRR